MLQRPLQFNHTLLKSVVQPGDLVVDATVGNGFDTQFLAELIGDDGKVFGFDIQAQAITETKQRLQKESLSHRVELHQLGHENMEQVLPKDQKIKACVFNLGYLPRSDKSIITLPETTLQALETALKHLSSGGIVTLMVYFGHEGGIEEKQAVLNYGRQLPQEQFTVFKYDIINQVNEPPFLLIIEKK